MSEKENLKLVDMNKMNKIIKKAAEEVIIELKKKNMIKKEMSYYQKVELLLYNYENLRDAVKQKDEDIKDLEVHGIPQVSKSVVVYSTNSGLKTTEDRYLQLKEKYLLEKQETQRDINRIEAALRKIEKDKYYEIIKIKYLLNTHEEEKKITDEYLAEKLGKSSKTIMRNRKRLMNKLITILFPESIREII